MNPPNHEESESASSQNERNNEEHINEESHPETSPTPQQSQYNTSDTPTLPSQVARQVEDTPTNPLTENIPTLSLTEDTPTNPLTENVPQAQPSIDDSTAPRIHAIKVSEEPTQRTPPPSSQSIDQQPTERVQPPSIDQQPTERVQPPIYEVPAYPATSEQPQTASPSSSGYGYPPAGPSSSGYAYPPTGPSSSGYGYPPTGTPPPDASRFYNDQMQHVQSPPTPPAKNPGKLAHPLPLWLTLAGIAVFIIILVVLHLSGSDWAAGAAHASAIGFIVVVLLLIALVVRTINGMSSSLNPTRGRQYLFSIVGIVLILVYSGICQFLQPTLHIEQANALANQQQWQAAINEYQLGGEHIKTSEDMARTYTSWGLALNKKLQYSTALNKFNTVITQTTSKVASDQIKRAETGAITARLALAQQSLQAKNYADASTSYGKILGLAYCDQTCHQQAGNNDITARIALGNQSMQAKNYTAATTRYDAILNLSYCNTNCHQQVIALDAKAYFQLAEADLKTKTYPAAVSAFDNILKNFPTTPEARQLHGDMAKALLGQGQSTRANDCSSAIPTYQRLSKEYGDTPQGKQAKGALSAPQTVQGTFSNVEPNTPFSQMALTTGLHGGIAQDQLFSKWDNAAMKTSIGGNGKFTFTNVPQGDYDLMWYSNDGTTEYVEFIYSETTQDPIYTANVGPLCPVNVGNVSNSQGFSSY